MMKLSLLHLVVCNLLLGILLLLLLQKEVYAIRRLPEQFQSSAAANTIHQQINPNDSSSTEHGRRLSQQELLVRHLKKKATTSSSPSIPSSPDEHLVTSLPLLSDSALTTKHWAGLLPASPDNDKFLFYWLFAPDTSASNNSNNNNNNDHRYDHPQEQDIPLIIWLNGGPGCSSMDGLFLENGPLRFVPDGESSNTYRLTTAPYSWHRAPAYVVYIDQPVGTGLSYTTSHKYPSNDRQVNEDFYYFLQQFVHVHADKFLTPTSNDSSTSIRRTFRRPLYFTGESHAGHYIPSMMAYILEQNDKEHNEQNALLPLSGAAIGNGWIDPRFQYAAAHAAYGHGLIGIAQQNALDQDEYACRQAVERNFPPVIPKSRRRDLQHPQQEHVGEPTEQELEQSPRQLADTSICFGLLDSVVSQTARSYKVSQYDSRVWERKGVDRSFPKGHKIVESYLGVSQAASFPSSEYSNAKVLSAIHATASRDAGQIYEECTDPPYNALAHQDALGVVPEVVQVLEYGRSEKKIRLLFFNGVFDLICNHVGNEITLENLPWTRRDDWIQAARYAWKANNIDPASPYVNSMVSGYYKAAENLAFLKVMDSGHMVPMDVPDVALDMIRTFVYDETFEEYEQELSRAKTSPQCDTCLECTASSSSRTSGKEAASPSQDETNELGRFVIAHAWMGAILGVVVFGMAILCKRQQQQQHRRMDSSAPYSLELQSVPPNGDNLGPVKYRDEDPNSFDDEDENESEDDVVDYEGGGGRRSEFAYKDDQATTNGHGGRGRPSSSSLKSPPPVV